MTPSLQGGFGRPDPAEPYKPHTIEEIKVSGEPRALELLVNIEGRDRRILLTTDALLDHGLSGPAAVVELRAIRAALERIADALFQGTESRSTDGPG